METFFQTHAYLIEQTNAPVRRALMDSIDWNYRMIGIKGPRGVGKTTFLLQYAKENFEPGMRQCLYVNMNSFYFQGRGLVDFADEFYRCRKHYFCTHCKSTGTDPRSFWYCVHVDGRIC